MVGAIIVGEWVSVRCRYRPVGLGQAEVEHLDEPSGVRRDVGRLQIAMDDPALVRRIQRVGDLPRDRQRFVERESARAESFCERSPSTSSSTSAWMPGCSSTP